VKRKFAADISAEEILFYARSDLQQREQWRLKRGEFPIEASLDLHRATITEASQQLNEFFLRASGLRCVHVIHGKGHGCTDGRATLTNKSLIMNTTHVT